MFVFDAVFLPERQRKSSRQSDPPADPGGLRRAAVDHGRRFVCAALMPLPSGARAGVSPGPPGVYVTVLRRQNMAQADLKKTPPGRNVRAGIFTYSVGASGSVVSSGACSSGDSCFGNSMMSM